MNYQEASALLEKGKFVARPLWKEQKGYLTFLPGLTHYLQVTLVNLLGEQKPNVVPWAADRDSTNADDWEEVDPFIIVESLVEKEKKE